MSDLTPDDVAIDEWLTYQHRAFIDALTGNLDLEVGLAAILPGELLGPPAPDAYPGSPKKVSGALAEMPVWERLQIRARYSRRLRALARLARYLSQADRDPDDGSPLRMFQNVFGQAFPDNYLAPFFERALTDFLVTAEAKLIAHPAELRDRSINEARTIREDIDELDAGRFGEGVGVYKREVGARDTKGLSFRQAERWSPGRAERPYGAAWAKSVVGFVLQDVVTADEQQRLAKIADRLNYFERMLNDFVGIDLSTVNLVGIPLDGLRWSESSTRWPPGWRELVERLSTQVDDTRELFEIQLESRAHQDTIM